MPAAPAIDLPLRDIHLPEPVSWWPPAPGWWLLGLALLLCLVGFWQWWRHRQRRRVLRQLEAELDRIWRQHLADGDNRATLERLSVLLRRACLSFYPRSDVAGLTGDRWLAFLNERTRGAFDARSADMLTLTLYRPAEPVEQGGIDRLIEITGRALPLLYRRALP